MQITAKQRYKPFTHQPGAKALLPGTDEEYTFYPDGIEEFTVLLDLETGTIVNFGKRYRKVIPNPKTVELERLSFGVHKKQEWEGIYKRCNIEEFLPIWYQMGQWYDSQEKPPKNSLLESCFLETDKIALAKKLQLLFKSGFSNLLFPQNLDLSRYGFDQEPLGENGDRTLLFSLGRTLIRSFFFRKEGNSLTFLPLVPKGIHCGRFLNIREEGLKMEFEWTKHLPRRLIVEVQNESSWTFRFPKEIREFRIKSLKSRFENGSLIRLLPGRYLLDQFKK